MSLTNKQLELVQKFWKRGWFWAWEVVSVFSSKTARDACIKRLFILDLVKEKDSKFHINRENFLKYQAEFENKKLGDFK